MRRKNYYDPRQLTFSFDVMADHIETLKNENNFEIGEAENGNRQTNSSSGNRNGRSITRNNKGSASSTTISQFSLFDTGSVGIESSRQVEKAGTKGHDSLNHDFIHPTADGRKNLDQRHSMGDEAIRLDGLRDITGTWGTDRVAANLKISSEVNLGSGNVTVKFADNIKALEILTRLDSEKAKTATSEEQQILVRYVGWGGMPQAFDPKNEQWRDRYELLRLLLDAEAYAKARRSTQDAHYTSETVIQGIYSGLGKLGVHNDHNNSLRILEPAAGIGHFIGLCPDTIKAEFVAVEQDTTTSNIAKYLYPQTEHINLGFQNTPIVDKYFDLVVGNPPFGQQSLFDDKHQDISKFSIHNYFLAKSILKLREGGIGAFVVSRYFMDSVDSKAREYIADQANFLGAIRLPQTAFKENALTQVTTDIVFFQKNTTGLNNKDWLNSDITTVYNNVGSIEDEANINNYFINNPAQIIGTMAYESSSYGKALTCVATKDIDLKAKINERLAYLPHDVYIARPKTIEPLPVHSIDKDFVERSYFKDLKTGAFCIEPTTNKIVCKCLGDFGVDSYKAVPIKRESERIRMVRMISIRDNLRSLINLEKSDAPADQIESTRNKLNHSYDNFIKQYGYLNSQFNRSLMRDDPECALIESFLRKSKLFADVQNGDVRILFGSTSKMGAGTNVQKRLLAAHHLDAPWRPSDVEQRNGRIIRQGNMFYERDPDFQVEINYYATKQMYDARMWQTIEYKAAGIEQFRKGDIAQRHIDDTTSDAANAADMKAAASGNPFILTQVQLASELKKLEALFTQHNREQYRLQDRLKKLGGAEERFQKSKNLYEANIKCRNANTMASLQGMYIDGKFLDKENKANKAVLLQKFSTHISEVAKLSHAKGYLMGTYRGFETTIQKRHENQFCFVIKGANEQKFYPDNLEYEITGNFSMSGFFQRLDNFLDKGLEQNFQNAQNAYRSELEQVNNVKANLDKEFPQKAELLLCRANNLAVIRELQKMGDDPDYVSTWTVATALTLLNLKADEKSVDTPALKDEIAQKEIGNTLDEAILNLGIQNFKGDGSDTDLKLITLEIRMAVKNKDIDRILGLETICQKIDAKELTPLKNTLDTEKQKNFTISKDILNNIKALWNKTKSPEDMKQYAENSALKSEATNMNLTDNTKNQLFYEIIPLTKSYRTVLRNSQQDSATTPQKNYYFTRLYAMDAIKKELGLQILQSLSIGKAVGKGLGR